MVPSLPIAVSFIRSQSYFLYRRLTAISLKKFTGCRKNISSHSNSMHISLSRPRVTKTNMSTPVHLATLYGDGRSKKWKSIAQPWRLITRQFMNAKQKRICHGPTGPRFTGPKILSSFLLAGLTYSFCDAWWTMRRLAQELTLTCDRSLDKYV